MAHGRVHWQKLLSIMLGFPLAILPLCNRCGREIVHHQVNEHARSSPVSLTHLLCVYVYYTDMI